ncbi:MAG: hypothetical protein HY831_03890 [Candidatus Aenigmarchaeota archaeon]|nr:hypothetical protein [Candidatus Aenigmarchaeota archaeon]
MLVSNTSTLVLLAKMNLLEKFLDISPKIAIPSQVKEEYSFEKDSYYAKIIDKMIEKKKIVVYDVDNKMLYEILKNFKLDLGEAAAYCLYKKGSFKAVLTDDKELIKLCKLEKVPFLCALAILVQMHKEKVLNKKDMEEKLGELISIARYSKDIVEYFTKELKGD